MIEKHFNIPKQPPMRKNVVTSNVLEMMKEYGYTDAEIKRAKSPSNGLIDILWKRSLANELCLHSVFTQVIDELREYIKAGAPDTVKLQKLVDECDYFQAKVNNKYEPLKIEVREDKDDKDQESWKLQ